MSSRTAFVLRWTACAAALATATPGLAGWRAGAYLGAAANHTSYVRIEQPARATAVDFRGVEYKGESFRPPVYYGYRLGYFFQRFGIEAEFIHQKIYARTGRTVEVSGQWRGAEVKGRWPMEKFVEQFSISHGLNMLLANIVLEKRAGARTSVVLRLGAGPTIPHPESSIQGEGRQQYELGRPAVQAAGGLEFHLWRGLYWLTEYKFTRTRQKVDIAAGTAETLVRSHHGVFGLGVRF